MNVNIGDKLPLYELKIQDAEDEVFALSLVENPAIEADWVYFSKDKKEEVKFATIDSDKHLIIAPVLIPDKKIIRIDDMGKEYLVFFTKDTIEKLAQNYLKNGYQDKATFEHSKNIDGDVTVVESWVSESSTKDKSSLYFNRTFPAGTWFVTFKVNNDTLWKDYIKTGVVKAVSIEGIFAHELVKQSKIDIILEKNITELSEEEAEVFLGKIKTIIKKDRRYKSGEKLEKESFNDYPDSMVNAAKSAVEWAEKNGWGSCLTPVGKQRASQLSKREPISVDTIKRIYSYVSRHEKDLQSSTSFSDGCGALAMAAWGGLGAGRWAKARLTELGLLEEAEAQPSISSTYPGEAADEIVAPALIVNPKKKKQTWSEIFASQNKK